MNALRLCVLSLLFALNTALAATPGQATPQPQAAAGVALLLEAERTFAEGDTLHALSLYQSIIEQDGNNAVAWLRLADLYRRDAQFQRSLDACAQLERIFPDERSAPQAAELLAASRVGRARTYLQMARAQIELAKQSSARAAVEAEIAELTRAAAAPLSSDSTAHSAATPAPIRSAVATGRAVDIRQSASGAPIVTRTTSTVPVIRGSGGRQ